MARFIVAVAVVAALVSGCGGGGGGGGGGGALAKDESPLTQKEIENALTPQRSVGGGRPDTAPSNASPRQAHNAAKAAPVPGSVTQGSAVLRGTTADRFSLRFIPSDRGTDRGLYPAHPIAQIRTGEGETLTSNTNPRRVQAHLPDGQIVYYDPEGPGPGADSYSYFPQVVFTPQDIVPFSSEFARPGNGRSRPVRELLIFDVLGGGSFGETDDGSTTVVGNPRGMTAYGFTDYEHGADDYVAWGWWGLYEFTPTDLEWTIGAFADGVETAHADVPATGTASYSGFSSGVAVKGAPPSRNNLDNAGTALDFISRVRLTADFSAASVTGTISDFRKRLYEGPSSEPEGTPGTPVEPAYLFPGLQVHLSSADMRTAETHSFFEGDTRTTGRLAGATGKWGGQFLGTPATGEAPPTIGGTWGVTQGEDADHWKIVGGFGAWQTP